MMRRRARPGVARLGGRPAPVLACAMLLTGAGLAGCAGAGSTAVPAVSGSASGPGASASPAARAHDGAAARPGGTAAPARAAQPLAGQVIALDPGHNGANWSHPAIIDRLVNVITEWKACDTAGAQTDAGYPEHAFTFDVAMRLARLLRAEGATVVLTRHNDHGVGPCVTQRAEIGNRAHADAAISIHADGGPPRAPASR